MKRVFLLLGLALLTSACDRSVALTFGPRELLDGQTATMELRVHPDGVCPANLDDALNRPPTAAEIVRVSAGIRGFGAVSGLPRARRAVSILLRDQSCNVQLLGCTEADLGSTSEVRITWRAPTAPVACPASANACAQGQCTYPQSSATDGGS